MLTSYLPRFGASNLHQRDARSALFEGYSGAGAQPSARAANTPSPNRGGYGYGYPGSASGSPGLGVPNQGGYRPATPNRKGQYSDAVLNELESQNDAQVDGILGKVRVLKDVRMPLESDGEVVEEYVGEDLD